MTDKCTSPEGHKEYGPWRIRYSTYLAQIKIERTNGRLVEEMPKEEAHRILNEHASLTERVRGFEQTMDALVERAERVQEGEDWDMAEFILRKRDAFLENEKDDPTAPDPAD